MSNATPTPPAEIPPLKKMWVVVADNGIADAYSLRPNKTDSIRAFTNSTTMNWNVAYTRYGYTCQQVEINFKKHEE